MIEPRYGVLQTLFADRVFRIPHYQRFYSWQRRQREDLFNDLNKLADGKDDQHHFMATIVCHRTSETKDVGAAQYRVYDVVDGQQRLTTLILLLKCIELALDPASEDRRDLAKTLVKRDGHLILLQTNNANEHNFNRFIREGRAPERADIQTYSDRNLAAAIRECSQHVEKWKASHDVLKLMRLVLHRLGFVVFDTEDSRLVYTVFEVLNSRGLAVDWLDKTKSVLMGRVYELAQSSAAMEAEISALQNIWAQFYREIAKEDIPGDEILRITATLYYGPGQGKPRSADEQEKGRVWRLRAADSIEHIFPQNYSAPAWRNKMRNANGQPEAPDAHVGRIGNLLLLPESVNKEAQDRAFDEKKKSYGKHNLRMIHKVRSLPNWTLAEIEAREKEILEWAKTRWSDL